MRHCLTVVLLSGGSVAAGRGDVVPVHVVALRHVVWSWRLAVAATEWFRFRRRNWFVDAGLWRWQRLVVRIPGTQSRVSLNLNIHDYFLTCICHC